MNEWFNNLRLSEFPAHWEKILQRQVPIYSLLPESDRRELKSYIRWFIGSKEFEGAHGLVITDEIRVMVAAQACLLLLHRETPCYERLRLIRIYPGDCFPESSAEDVAGESWPHGVVVLAWDSVRGGAVNPYDGYNVVLHEFAHQLDEEDGESDGTPLLSRGRPAAEKPGLYTAWVKMLSNEFEQFRQALREGQNTVLDSYGSSSPAEFFAVATECFFEKPQQLLKKSPALYEALREFYRQDPARWASQTITVSNDSAGPRPASKAPELSRRQMKKHPARGALVA